MAFSQKVLTVGDKTVSVEPTGRIRLGPGSAVQVWNGALWSGAYDEGELVALGVDMDDLKAAAKRAAATDADFAAWLATPYNNGDRQFPRAPRAAEGDVPRETIASLNQEIGRDEAQVLAEAVRGLVLRSGRGDIGATEIKGMHVKITDTSGGVVFKGTVADPTSLVLGADLWRGLCDRSAERRAADAAEAARDRDGLQRVGDEKMIGGVVHRWNGSRWENTYKMV